MKVTAKNSLLHFGAVLFVMSATAAKAYDKFDIQVCEASASATKKLVCLRELGISKSCASKDVLGEIGCYQAAAKQKLAVDEAVTEARQRKELLEKDAAASGSRSTINTLSREPSSPTNPSDVAQAERFRTGLPAACSSSSVYQSGDGTVNIRVICHGSGKSMDGLISIKNGVVTKIR